MYLRLLPIAFATALLVPTAVAAPLTLPAPSVWKLNPAASTAGDKSTPSADNTLTVSSYSKSSVVIKAHFVGGDAKPMDVTFSGAPDGRPHRYAGGSGSFREDGVYTFEQTDGTREYGTLTLSPDGRTLTNTYMIKPRIGASTQVVSVYTRLK